MKTTLFLLVWAALAFATDDSVEETTSHDFRIAGYLPDYRIEAYDLEAAANFLDDVYLFSLAPQPQLGPKMFSLCCLMDLHYEKVAAVPNVIVWVTVGGAGRSHRMVSQPSSMIAAMRQLAIEHSFIRGFDFDCELFNSHQDYKDYESLVESAAKILHQDNLQVSVALHAGQTLPDSIYHAVDRVNLMAYDLAGATFHGDFGKVRNAVQNLINSGCPAYKIFLGIPAYGRNPRNPGEAKTYAELVESASDTTNLQNRYEYEGILVDSPAAVAAKVRYAVLSGLGGAFFWELGQDKQSEGHAGTLLEAASRGLQRAQELREEVEDEEVTEEEVRDEL